jgi:hypothetical protein
VRDERNVRFPSVRRVIEMNRSDLRKLANRLALATVREAPRRDNARRRVAAGVIGGLAVSFARVGDLEMVAALSRAGARWHYNHPFLDEAEDYMLDQQHPDGYFGLYSGELERGTPPAEIAAVIGRLSVGVMWALAERNRAQ